MFRAKRIAMLSLEREYRLYDACPSLRAHCSELPDASSDITKYNADIAKACGAMAKCERADPQIGAAAFWPGVEPSTVMRTALALLAVRAASSAIEVYMRTVGDLIDLAAAQDVDSALELRAAFEVDGVLSPYVQCEPAQSVDRRGSPGLTEPAWPLLSGRREVCR